MKQSTKVIVVLAVFGAGFAVLTGLGFRFPEADDDPETWRTKPLPSWLTTVGNWLPSRMPSIDLSDTQVIPDTREGDVVLVGQAPVTIVVPRSDEDFRQANLSLESGPPVSVYVTDEGMDADPPEEPPKLESVEAAGQGEEKMRVIISGEGGTILLRRPPQEGEESRVLFE